MIAASRGSVAGALATTVGTERALTTAASSPAATAANGALTDAQLEQDRAQGVHVAAPRRRLTGPHLGRHVVGRADQTADDDVAILDHPG
jgi:hypothetical protein